MKNKEKFLEELTELCNKYKVKINACGCCGSPNVNDLSEKEIILKYEMDGEENETAYDYLTAVTNLDEE